MLEVQWVVARAVAMAWAEVSWGAGVVFTALAELSAVEWVNLCLALAIALVALGAANRMNRETEVTIIVSFSTVGAGALGFALGSLLPERWVDAAYTILLGGVLALLVGTRRQTLWLPPAWMPKLSIAISAATWAAFFWLAH